MTNSAIAISTISAIKPTSMIRPTNPRMFTTPCELTLNNWNPNMTESKIRGLFQCNGAADVGKVTVNRADQTATVLINKWHDTEAGRMALFHVTFSKFFDVCVDGWNDKSSGKRTFLLFTVDPKLQSQMQRLSGPPGLSMC
jgi:hypothetical protein